MPTCILYRHAVKFKTTWKIFYPLKLTNIKVSS